MRLIVVCEAPADFELASCLILRSLRHHGPAWFKDLPQIVIFSGWTGSGQSDYALWKDIGTRYTESGGRPLLGRRRGPYSIPATKAVILAGKEMDLEALVLMVDLDREAERRDAMDGVRQEASGSKFEILLATPDPEREAWVLHGFEPANGREEKRLAKVQQDLGFDPRLQPHRLRDDARRVETRRDIKKVLDELVDDDRDREPQCWEMAPLDLLEERGGKTFLADFLVEIRERLLPKLAGGPSA